MKRYRKLFIFSFSCASLLIILFTHIISNLVHNALTPPLGLISPYWKFYVTAGEKTTQTSQIYNHLIGSISGNVFFDLIFMPYNSSVLYIYDKSGIENLDNQLPYVMVRNGTAYERMIINNKLLFNGREYNVTDIFDTNSPLAIYPNTSLVFSLSQAPCTQGIYFVGNASFNDIAAMGEYFNKHNYAYIIENGMSSFSIETVINILITKEGLVALLVLFITLYALFATCEFFLHSQKTMIYTHLICGATKMRVWQFIFMKLQVFVLVGSLSGALMHIMLCMLLGLRVSAGVFLLSILLAILLIFIIILLSFSIGIHIKHKGKELV